MEALLGGAPPGAKVALKPPGMAGHILRREDRWENVVEMSHDIPILLLEYLRELITEVNSLLKILHDIVH